MNGQIKKRILLLNNNHSYDNINRFILRSCLKTVQHNSYGG
jgi:hypothetical protein